MTTISASSTIGVTLSLPSYISPIVINPGVTLSSSANIISAATGSWIIENYGSIGNTNLSATGISLSAGGSVTNASSASVSDYNGIEISGNAGTVVNDGSIAGATNYIFPDDFGVGVYVGSGGSITNAVSASISAFDAVRVGGTGTVVNYGDIVGAGVYHLLYPIGVRMFAGSLTNAASASITGDVGVYGGGGVVNVVNAGSIGGADTGVSLSTGGSVTNQSGASISGAFDGIFAAGGMFEVGVTVLNQGSITGGDGVYSSSGGSVTNAASASITGGNGVRFNFSEAGAVVNDGSIRGTSAWGVYLGGGGPVTNAASASITGTSAGVEELGDAAVAVYNYGIIAGTVQGVALGGGGSVTNGASGLITGGAGVQIEPVGTATVVNRGSIVGTYTGVYLARGSVTNMASASITGETGVRVNDNEFFDDTGTVDNNGSIAGTGTYGFGVALFSGGSVTNAASASITGATGVYTGIGTTLYDTYNQGTVVNAGSIAGTETSGSGVDVFTGSITNEASAWIIGATGVFMAGTIMAPNFLVLTGRGAVVNAGSIDGTSGPGVDMNYGSVTNAASASITGDAFGVDLSGGGTLTNAGVIIGNSGTAVYLGGNSSNLVVLDPGYGLTGVVIGGTSATNALELASAASAGTLSGLGTEFVNFVETTIDANASWVLNGANTIEAGTTLTELGDATMTVTGTLANNGSIVLDPSTMTAGGLTGTGLTTIDAGSTLEVQGTVAGGETLMFAGNGAYLHLDDPGGVAGAATNFALGETIDLTGVDPGSVTYSGGFLNVSGGSFALSLANPGTVTASPTGDGAAVSVLCFCVNTLISTPSGERPVQELAAGDMVTTHRGEARRIVWIGTGKVLATQGQRNAGTPVIVCQSALADNVPNRDLRVTKGHSLYIDDVLIPVEFLVNHRPIFWDDNAQKVELYHIELETHDVLMANGAPAESYRDDGNRWLFRNANSGWGLPPQLPCASVLTGGPVVDAAWRRLLERAGPRPGVPVTDDPDLHLLVDGRRVDAASRSDVWHVFHLPAPPASVRIISHSGVPQEMGLARDPRCLGVALRRIMVAHGAQTRTIEAENALLTDGFHGYEADNNIRWTSGDAAMPPGLFEGFDGPLEIALRLGGRTSYPDEGTLLRAA